MGVILNLSEDDVGKTLTAIVDLKTNANPTYLQVRTASISQLINISIPVTDWATYRISHEIVSTDMYVWVYTVPNTQLNIFMDNLRITIQ